MLSEQKLVYSREGAAMLALSFYLPFELGLEVWDAVTSSKLANWDKVKYLDWLREVSCKYSDIEISRIENFFSLIKSQHS